MAMSTTLDWYGCSTFCLKTAGLSIFLDAYIDRPIGADGTGLSASDVEQADWVLIGHAHFDHLYGAEEIIRNTDARLVGSYESVRVMETAGVPLDRMICVQGGEYIDLGRGVKLRVYPSQHSCVWSHLGMVQPDTQCIGDLGVTWQSQQAAMRRLTSYLAQETSDAVKAHLAETGSGHSKRGDGGALVFLIEAPDGSLLFKDTSGHWSGVLEGLRPDVAILAAAGRGNIDGEPIQGSLCDFLAKEVEYLQPSTVLLSHHDNWLPGFSVATDTRSIVESIRQVRPETSVIEPGYLESTELFVGKA